MKVSYNSTQFYLKDDSILINLNNIDTIFKAKNNVIITFANKEKKSITETFENELQVEKYFMYLVNSIYNGDPLISKSVFMKIIEKENNDD